MSDDYGIDKFGMPLDTPSGQNDDERALIEAPCRSFAFEDIEHEFDIFERPSADHSRAMLEYIRQLEAAFSALRSRLALPAQAAPSEEEKLATLCADLDYLARVVDEQGLQYVCNARECVEELRAALASERGKREGDWSICMIYPAPGDPFRRIECQIIDRGYADRIMTIACPSELAYESPAPDATALREADDDAVARTLQYLNAELDKRDVTIKTALERLDFARAALLRSESRGE